MRTWYVPTGGYAGYDISGDTLVDAVEANFDRIARDLELGNAAGYRLVKVVLHYRPGILGGKGGAELIIRSKGLDLAHRPADPAATQTTVWIYATPDDLPAPVTLYEEDGMDARMEIRLPGDLKKWVMDNGGSEMVRRLIEQARLTP